MTTEHDPKLVDTKHELEFEEGADVYTSDGKKVGDIDRVVVDPKTEEITHLVVRQGFIFTNDKVVPIELVSSTTPKRVVLKKVDDLDDLPDFEESFYVRVDQIETGAEPETNMTFVGGYIRPYYWYPALGYTWWGAPYGAYAAPPYVRRVKQTRRNIPEDEIPLEEGAKVITSDGKHVGSIERVFVDPDDDRVSHLLISEGLFLKERKVAPSSWITQVEEDEVHLAVTSKLLESLPEYQEQE